ncbi:MAG: hypothetical protein ACREE9_08220 [Stellaceae bacterium]
MAEVADVGGQIEARGDRLLLSAPRPLPPALVARVAAAKPELLTALADPVIDWHARHAEALAHWCALYPPGQAAPLAWGELQNRWHRLFGARPPERQCAGCGAPVDPDDRFDTGDGNRVHFGDRHGLDCLIAYGKRWRGAATRALVAMGLEPPPDV